MTEQVVIHWFRRDLRLEDNPALLSASHHTVLPIYILDETETPAIGSASRWWLHHSLKSLNDSLGHRLSLYKGNSKEILLDLVERYSVKEIYWNQSYEPWWIKNDQEITDLLEGRGVEVHSFNGSFLIDPATLLKDNGTPYQVFTPFYEKCLKSFRSRSITPLERPSTTKIMKDQEKSLSLDQLALKPPHSWAEKFKKYWDIGEEAAQKRLSDFLENGLNHYHKERDFPHKESTSRLSPYLHFGEISPQRVLWDVQQKEMDDNAQKFITELFWREFSTYLLHHFPTLPHHNLQVKFNGFPWEENHTLLEGWQKGQTGYPIIDAGMRELWQTGFMHNRVRMLVASFLTKNLLIPWQTGAAWFSDCLVDADLASNSASWQWVAGCGMDAAPYFRIFNPVLQSSKFDPKGDYIYQYVPELKNLPAPYLFSPWDAPQHVLEKAGIVLGATYPYPIVDFKLSRERALEIFSGL